MPGRRAGAASVPRRSGCSGRASRQPLAGPRPRRGAWAAGDGAGAPGGSARSQALAAPDRVRQLRLRLLAFFDARHRDLPWRRDRHDPYRVWVAEVMLQQTRADAVIPYYRAWLERFPNLAALADAELDDVLRLWQGLGYYARARNLHRAARIVRERYGGELPRDVEALRALPGVGHYTAGAVASIAFGLPAPAVDGNARRVLARLLDLPYPSPAELRALAAALVDPQRPGEFNQALMELGATLCSPRAPACERCPVEPLCAARAAGTVLERPAPRPRAPLPVVEIGVAVLVNLHQRVLVVRRPESGLLAGLWEFPGEALRDGEGANQAARRAAARLPLRLRSRGRELEPVRHQFSHFKAVYRPVLFRVRRTGPFKKARTRARWVRWSELEGLPLPAAQRRIAEALEELVLP